MHDIDRAVQLAPWEACFIYPHPLLESLAAHVVLEFRVLSAMLEHSEPPSVAALPASLATIPKVILEHILGELPQGFDALRRPVLEVINHQPRHAHPRIGDRWQEFYVIQRRLARTPPTKRSSVERPPQIEGQLTTS